MCSRPGSLLIFTQNFLEHTNPGGRACPSNLFYFGIQRRYQSTLLLFLTVKAPRPTRVKPLPPPCAEAPGLQAAFLSPPSHLLEQKPLPTCRAQSDPFPCCTWQHTFYFLFASSSTMSLNFLYIPLGNEP